MRLTIAATVSAALLAALLAAPATATQNDLPPLVEAVHQSGAVGVLAEVDTPTGRHRATAGVADLATGAPVIPNGEFRIASVTKTFVATVALQLVGEGRLSLDDTVARWLPGLVSGPGYDATRITVRELLQHTSGIPEYADDLPEFASAAAFRADRFTTYPPERLVAMALRHPPLFAPGTGWSYADTNYVLAGMIIGKVTGRNWARAVHDRILAPLGLRHTWTPGPNPLIAGPHAAGYYPFGGGPLVDVTAQNMTWADAGGAMISTAADLSRFYAALVGGRLLRPAQLAEMEATVPITAANNPFPGTRYGLGLTWFPLPCGGGYYGHEGGLPGYITWTGVTPDARRTVVVSLTGLPGSLDAVLALADREFCVVSDRGVTVRA